MNYSQLTTIAIRQKILSMCFKKTQRFRGTNKVQKSSETFNCLNCRHSVTTISTHCVDYILGAVSLAYRENPNCRITETTIPYPISTSQYKTSQRSNEVYRQPI